MKRIVAAITLAVLIAAGGAATVNALRVDVAHPPCCLKVEQLPAQPELKVINNDGMQPSGKVEYNGTILQGS